MIIYLLTYWQRHYVFLDVALHLSAIFNSFKTLRVVFDSSPMNINYLCWILYWLSSTMISFTAISKV